MSVQDEQKTKNKQKEDLLIDLATDTSHPDETKSPEGVARPGNIFATNPTADSSSNRTSSIDSNTDLELKEDHFPREHVVDARDTLDKVAAKYDTTPTRLAQYNKLTSRFIFAGQVNLTVLAPFWSFVAYFSWPFSHFRTISLTICRQPHYLHICLFMH